MWGLLRSSPTAENLLPPGDVAALRGALQAFVDDPARAEAEMRRRLDYVREHFSVDRMASEIEALYRQVLAQFRPRP
jgi:glycosyltransferase involved in cell wall biosynthesis